jgi:hypothetical protein
VATLRHPELFWNVSILVLLPAFLAFAQSQFGEVVKNLCYRTNLVEMPTNATIDKTRNEGRKETFQKHGLAGSANTAWLPHQLRHRACGGFLAQNSPARCQS